MKAIGKLLGPILAALLPAIVAATLMTTLVPGALTGYLPLAFAPYELWSAMLAFVLISGVASFIVPKVRHVLAALSVAFGTVLLPAWTIAYLANGAFGNLMIYDLLALGAIAAISPWFRSWMVFASGFEVTGAMFTVVLGVPFAIVGAAAGYFLGDTISGAVYGYGIGAALTTARYFWWCTEGFKMVRKPGYYAPYPWKLERIVYVWITRQIVSMSLGSKLVSGTNNAKFDGAMIIGGNHQSGLDFLTIRTAVLWSFRQITQIAQLSLCGQLFAGLGAFGGSFGVASEGGKSQGKANEVIESCSRMLADIQEQKSVFAKANDTFWRVIAYLFSESLWVWGRSKTEIDSSGTTRNKLLLYAQGKLVFDNLQRPADYRTGIIRIMHHSSELSGNRNIALLPVATHYWTEPMNGKASRLRKAVAQLWVATNYAAKPFFGHTEVIGSPIPLSSLPEDPRAAVEIYRQHVERQLIQAKLITYGVGCDKALPMQERMDRAYEVTHAFVSHEMFARALATYEVQEVAMFEASVDDLVAAGLSREDAEIAKRIYPSSDIDAVKLAITGPDLNKARKLCAAGINGDTLRPLFESNVFRDAEKEFRSLEKALSNLTAEKLVEGGLTAAQAEEVKKVYRLPRSR